MTFRWWGLALLLAGAGCTRSHGTVELMAPFSDDTVVGALTATWRDAGEWRLAGGPDTPERKVLFRVDAVNRLSDRLYVRLRDFRLLARGEAIDTAASAECTLAAGATDGVLAGALWVPASLAQRIGGFQIDRFAVPLSERGRAFYREFLLLQRPGAAAAIDTELAAYASAPPCTSTQWPRGF
jgi:hypothetical protein